MSYTRPLVRTPLVPRTNQEATTQQTNLPTDETVCWDLVVTIDLGYGSFSGVRIRRFTWECFLYRLSLEGTWKHNAHLWIHVPRASDGHSGSPWNDRSNQIHGNVHTAPNYSKWLVSAPGDIATSFLDDPIVFKLKTKVLLIVWMPGWKHLLNASVQEPTGTQN